MLHQGRGWITKKPQKATFALNAVISGTLFTLAMFISEGYNWYHHMLVKWEVTDLHLTDLINEQQILLSFEAKDKLEVIHKLATLLDSQDLLHSFEDYKRAVLEREETFSTSVGMNVAIPHGRSSAVKRAAVAFGRLNPPIEWEKGSGEEVKLVFLLAVPESGADNQHLAILAALSRALVHDEKRQEFLTARNIEELMKAFEGITVK